jgi:hypothetical protein
MIYKPRPFRPVNLVIEATEETAMLKKMSAALIAVSMLAAPAMAASATKTQTAPITKPVAGVAKPEVKPSALNANAKMVRHHHRHVRHHVAHKKMSSSGFNKVSIKHASPAVKRG